MITIRRAIPDVDTDRSQPPISAVGVTAGYGGPPVVHDLDLHVHAGEVVALLGANGAGKTTTMLALAGELPLRSGEVHRHGRVTTAPLHKRARDGLMFVTEERSIFRDLSVRDNVRVAGVSLAEVLTLFPELESRLDVRSGLLSGGEQQMLTLARAIGRRPKVLLADELSLGLAPIIVQRLLSAVRQTADEHGTAVLLVEQHARQALRHADRAYVMRRGRMVISGTANELIPRLSDIEAQYLSAAAASD